MLKRISLLLVILLFASCLGIASTSSQSSIATTRSATIVIASTTSTLQSQVQADILCNGENDQIEIQLAIDSLPEYYKGEVLVKEGAYNIQSTILLPVGDWSRTLVISGVGRGTIFQLFGNSLFQPSDINQPFQGEICNMEWHGRGVEGSGYYGSAYRADFHHLYIHDFADNGFELLKGTGGTDSNTHITDCIFENNGGAIYIDELSWFWITDNWFTSNYQSIYTDRASGLYILDNLFGDVDDSGYHVNLSGGQYIWVSRNSFITQNASVTSIKLDGADGSFIEKVDISNNFIIPTVSPGSTPLMMIGDVGSQYDISIVENTFRVAQGLTADSIIKIVGTSMYGGKIRNNLMQVDGTVTNGIINGTIPPTMIVEGNQN